MSEALQAQGWVESSDENFVWVRTQRETACGGCQGQSTCGTGSLSKLFSLGHQPLLKLPNSLAARPGDRVILELNGTSLIKQAVLAYGFPLIGLFIGALMVSFMFSEVQDWQIALGSLIGLVSAWLWVRLNHRPEQPKIVEVIRSQL
ncbi:SoxR reducing system RseC family protein [Thiomicrospira microaerophila]|uniref:SoxR reducing system RseC family protein n=1 Tax=Thiomicrospira microaerophila TaxID=406020 RepID=UPI00200FB9E3|nr:SoxR reducing system RseC family protein [Thiomicrospira microaerophila]UQB43213.1 SoxR reducing system RseC family protein [Thiomicrospira microaerophila]